MEVLGTDVHFVWLGASPGRIPVWIVISCLHWPPLARSVACGVGRSGWWLRRVGRAWRIWFLFSRTLDLLHVVSL